MKNKSKLDEVMENAEWIGERNEAQFDIQLGGSVCINAINLFIYSFFRAHFLLPFGTHMEFQSYIVINDYIGVTSSHIWMGEIDNAT